MGFRPHTRKDALIFGLSSGLSEGCIAALGFFLGSRLMKSIESFDHWIAFSLLFFVGARMFWSALQNLRSPAAEEEEPKEFHSRGHVLLVSIATSFDALGVGLGLGIAGRPILLYAPMIGLGAFLATLLGLRIARLFSKKMGPQVELLGGIILMILAFPLLKI